MTVEAEHPTSRTCAHCARPLPASATSRRRFCSADCRTAAWNEENPGPGRRPDGDGLPMILTMAGWRASVALHWHKGSVDPGGNVWAAAHLAGDVQRGYWRGAGCPPRCDTPIVPGGWAVGIPVGREGLVPPSKPSDWAAELDQ